MTREELVMGTADKLISRLAPHPKPQQRRTPGRLAGKIRIDPDFDDTPEDIIAAFEGNLDVRGGGQADC